MTIERVDHVTEGLSRLTSELDKENVTKFLSVFLERYQEIEDAFLILANQKSIEEAEGVWLDYIGKILNVPRDFREDMSYRDALKLQISTTNTSGTPQVLKDLVKDFTEATKVLLVEYGEGYGTITTNGKSSLGSALWDLVEDSKPVTTYLAVRSDYNDNAFYPVFEEAIGQGEVFTTTDDGIVYENFNVTSDGEGYSEFFTSVSADTYYKHSLKGEQNQLYYETGRQFQFTSDGTRFEDAELFTEGELQSFEVVDPYREGYGKPNVRPFVWEETSTSYQRNPELEELEINIAALTNYLNNTLIYDLT